LPTESRFASSPASGTGSPTPAGCSDSALRYLLDADRSRPGFLTLPKALASSVTAAHRPSTRPCRPLAPLALLGWLLAGQPTPAAALEPAAEPRLPRSSPRLGAGNVSMRKMARRSAPLRLPAEQPGARALWQRPRLPVGVCPHQRGTREAGSGQTPRLRRQRQKEEPSAEQPSCGQPRSELLKHQ